jgi:hypothetical protein
MQKTVAVITGLLVLVHSVLGCCALEFSHHGEASAHVSQVAAAGDASCLESTEDGQPAHEHECCHVTCQWIASGGVDRVEIPQRDCAISSAAMQWVASFHASSDGSHVAEAAWGAPPPVRRYLQFGALLI